WLDTRGLADLHLAGLATDRLQKPVELAVDLRVQHALRDELIAARATFKAVAAVGPPPHRAPRQGTSLASPPRPPPPTPPPAPPGRVRDGFDLQGAYPRDGARLRQGHAQIRVRRQPSAAIRQVRDPRLPRPEPRAHGPRNLHLFLQYRHRAHGAEPRDRA